MTKQQKEFLKTLQLELNTQENDGQAAPRFWVVAQYEWEPCWEEQMDEYHYCNNETCYESFEEFMVMLKENFPDTDFSDVDDFFDLELNHPDTIDGYYKVPVHKVHVLKRDTFFLTKRECQEHIKRNHYHYNDTVHTYALTAWRSPQVEELLKILTTGNFDKEEE